MNEVTASAIHREIDRLKGERASARTQIRSMDLHRADLVNRVTGLENAIRLLTEDLNA